MRKNSIANGSGAMRPRANTIGHVDGAQLGLLAAMNSTVAQKRTMSGLQEHSNGLNGFHRFESMDYRGLNSASGAHAAASRPPRGLTRIETQGLSLDLGGNLRTAPPWQEVPPDYGYEEFGSHPGNTVNPAELHFIDSPGSIPFDSPVSPYPNGFGVDSAVIDEDGSYEWMNGIDHSMSMIEDNEQAIAGSSPSAGSSGSPDVAHEIMPDGPLDVSQSAAPWQSSLLSQAPMMADYPMDMSGSGFPMNMTGQFSPGTMDMTNIEPSFPFPSVLGTQDLGPSPMPTFGYPIHPPLVLNPDTPSTATSWRMSNRQSSVTSISTNSITDATRSSLVASLSQPSTASQKGFWQKPGGSPSASNSSTRAKAAFDASIPSASDLQRYVDAYVRGFYSHLPFIHLPTLSFDSLTCSASFAFDGEMHLDNSLDPAGGCLMLAMAAIGALHEYEPAVSKDLFELAKRVITRYLEDRRRGQASTAPHEIPLWLVQAMLLTMVYGQNCGDKTSADIASMHLATLVSLAQGAGLMEPTEIRLPSGHDAITGHAWGTITHLDEANWYAWKNAEERKRTLFAIFTLSSALVTAYHHAPALTNSEIQLELPCNEALWTASTFEEWAALGGLAAANSTTTPFAVALRLLLTACDQGPIHPMPMQNSAFNPSLAHEAGNTTPFRALFPASAFGCRLLLDAILTYIHETRQRHHGHPWSERETQALCQRVEPALAALQAVWSTTVVSPPSTPKLHPQQALAIQQHEQGSVVAADFRPIFELVHLRLILNPSRAKEFFWQRDYDGVAREVARGAEYAPYGDSSSGPDSRIPAIPETMESDTATSPLDHIPPVSSQPSPREQILRTAAARAIHALSFLATEQAASTQSSTEPPPPAIPTALCLADAAQAAGEWCATLQERVGRFFGGALGSKAIDLRALPAAALLEPDERALLTELERVLEAVRARTGAAGDGEEMGYAERVLRAVAAWLERGAVWPGKWTSRFLQSSFVGGVRMVCS